jgi:hypothetical protein
VEQKDGIKKWYDTEWLRKAKPPRLCTLWHYFGNAPYIHKDDFFAMMQKIDKDAWTASELNRVTEIVHADHNGMLSVYGLLDWLDGDYSLIRDSILPPSPSSGAGQPDARPVQRLQKENDRLYMLLLNMAADHLDEDEIDFKLTAARRLESIADERSHKQREIQMQALESGILCRNRRGEVEKELSLLEGSEQKQEHLKEILGQLQQMEELENRLEQLPDVAALAAENARLSALSVAPAEEEELDLDLQGTQEEADAATKLQATFRGKQARKSVSKIKAGGASPKSPKKKAKAKGNAKDVNSTPVSPRSDEDANTTPAPVENTGLDPEMELYRKQNARLTEQLRRLQSKIPSMFSQRDAQIASTTRLLVAYGHCSRPCDPADVHVLMDSRRPAVWTYTACSLTLWASQGLAIMKAMKHWGQVIDAAPLTLMPVLESAVGDAVQDTTLSNSVAMRILDNRKEPIKIAKKPIFEGCVLRCKVDIHENAGTAQRRCTPRGASGTPKDGIKINVQFLDPGFSPAELGLSDLEWDKESIGMRVCPAEWIVDECNVQVKLNGKPLTKGCNLKYEGTLAVDGADGSIPCQAFEMNQARLTFGENEWIVKDQDDMLNKTDSREDASNFAVQRSGNGFVLEGAGEREFVKERLDGKSFLKTVNGKYVALDPEVQQLTVTTESESRVEVVDLLTVQFRDGKKKLVPLPELDWNDDPGSAEDRRLCLEGSKDEMGVDAKAYLKKNADISPNYVMHFTHPVPYDFELGLYIFDSSAANRLKKLQMSKLDKDGRLSLAQMFAEAKRHQIYNVMMIGCKTGSLESQQAAKLAREKELDKK